MKSPKASKPSSRVRNRTRSVKISSTAHGLTSQAGLIPVVKYLDRTGFEKTVERSVGHSRGDNADYHLSDVVLLTMVGMIGGATSMIKVTTVWADSVLRKIAGWIKVPVETTILRIFKEVSEEQISQFEALTHILRGQHWRRLLRSGKSKTGIQPVHWVDMDSTVDTVCGRQEGSAKGFNPKKKGARSYHPQIAFLVETKEILQAWFRTGNAYTSNGAVEFTKQLLAHLPNRMRIIFRCDSGYFDGNLLDLLDTKGHGYLIKVNLKNLIPLLTGQNWTPIKNQPDWEQCEFQHSCGGWSRSRRFVAVRMKKPKKVTTAQSDLWETGEYEYDYFCYVTTEAFAPWQTHKKYGERATCETWIEEAKSQMGLGKIRTDQFLANAALFHCAVLAYNTVRWMAQLSGNKTLCQWEPETLRTYLIRTAGKLLTGNNQLRVKTPADPLYPREWEDWVKVGLLA